MSLYWSLANRFGILRDESGRVWHAGHANDVLEISSSAVLVASDSGGVWMLTTAFGLPLSLDWDAPEMRALERGPNGSVHFFAGGISPNGVKGALYQTNVSAGIPLWEPWLPIPLPDGVGTIRRIVVDAEMRKIVLATWGGLWYSPIPTGGSGAPFNFQLASGVDAGADFTGLALGPYHTILAACGGTILTGGWDRDRLVMIPATLPPLDLSKFVHVILAVAPSSPNIAYASACSMEGGGGAQGTFYVFLRSEDGGGSWSTRPAMQVGTSGPIVEHDQIAYTGAIAVSPTAPDTVVLGYTKGPYISIDGGNNFTWNEPTHDDKHSYRFTPGGRLYEASDGGAAFSNDTGATFDSLLNRELANLQFLGPLARDWWGRFNASYQVPGLVGGGTQDNNDLFSYRWPNGSWTPWRKLDVGGDFDGQAVFFVRTGGSVFSYGDVRTAAWANPLLVPDPTPIPIGTGKPGMTYQNNSLGGGPISLVNSPQWRNQAGLLMYMVAANGPDIYGLFANDDGTNKHWDYLTTLPLPDGTVVSALNSGSGHRILVGLRGRGWIWNIDTSRPNAPIISVGFPTASDGSIFIVDLVFERDVRPFKAFAAYNNLSSNQGAVYQTTDAIHWTRCPGQPAGGLPICCLTVDWTTSPQTLYVATDAKVFSSRNNGRTWVDESAGLPRRPHGSDLAFVAEPDGTRRLYLSTFGWSVWSTIVH